MPDCLLNDLWARGVTPPQRMRSLIAPPGRHQLGEVAYAAELELLDGPLAAAEDLRGLGDAEPLEEPHDQAVVLLVGQLAETTEQHLVGESGEHGVLRPLGGVVVG